MCGWGFETIYQIRGEKEPEKPKKWHGELAVGYDFLNVSAKPNNKADYIFLGSIQTLPSITYYLNRDLPHRFGLYGGVGTGLVVLKNFRAYDSVGNTYGISGDTWGLTVSGGGSFLIAGHSATRAGVSIFAEISYEVRNFPSIAYTLPSGQTALPANLPKSVSTNGRVFNFGLELTFPRKDEKERKGAGGS